MCERKQTGQKHAFPAESPHHLRASIMIHNPWLTSGKGARRRHFFFSMFQELFNSSLAICTVFHHTWYADLITTGSNVIIRLSLFHLPKDRLNAAVEVLQRTKSVANDRVTEPSTARCINTHERLTSSTHSQHNLYSFYRNLQSKAQQAWPLFLLPDKSS